MKFLIWIIFCMVLFSSGGQAQPYVKQDGRVDNIFKENIDFTGDGKNEQITLHVQGQSIMHPFIWELKIFSDEKLIFQYKSDDSWLDEFFRDEGYVDGCNRYIECKNIYYFKILRQTLFSKAKDALDSSILDPNNQNSVYKVIRKYIKDTSNFSDKEIDKIMLRITNQFQSDKAIILNVPISPVQNTPPKIYVKEVNKFVPVYEE